MTAEIDKGYLGQRLLELGFRAWMLYMFRVIEGVPFITERLHDAQFGQFQRIIDGADTRVNANMPPRTGKTTNCAYLCAYALALNPKSQIIYTSFNQDLLAQVSNKVASIMQHPVYQAMYGNVKPATTTVESDPIDEFWADYLLKNTGQAKYSSRKITTAVGGVILFNSIGSAITGFGAGVRNAAGFSGLIIIDDGDKPTDVHSEKIREKTHTYFSDTLLTRLNNSDTPILNMQQRLHIDDLTGYLERVYGFKTFKFPLLDENGVCNLPRQYTAERITELQKNSATFSAQYQQMPVKQGGNLIKTEWFCRFDAEPARFDNLFIVCDTAFTDKKSADNSAFGLFGTVGKDIYMLRGYCKKVIFPDLQRDLINFYQAAVSDYKNVNLSAIYIENKGSGISLIQQLRASGLPVREVMPVVHDAYLKRDQVSDKFTRFNEIAADLESGYFHIPESASWLLEFISECEAFTGGKQDAHDDYVDVLIYALKIRRKATQTDWTQFRNNFMR